MPAACLNCGTYRRVGHLQSGLTWDPSCSGLRGGNAACLLPLGSGYLGNSYSLLQQLLSFLFARQILLHNLDVVCWLLLKMSGCILEDFAVMQLALGYHILVSKMHSCKLFADTISLFCPWGCHPTRWECWEPVAVGIQTFCMCLLKFPLT